MTDFTYQVWDTITNTELTWLKDVSFDPVTMNLHFDTYPNENGTYYLKLKMIYKGITEVFP